MTEPTFKQHKILAQIAEKGDAYKTGKEVNIELYWELVRSGYLNNLVVISGKHEWRFKPTEKAIDYLDSIEQD